MSAKVSKIRKTGRPETCGNGLWTERSDAVLMMNRLIEQKTGRERTKQLKAAEGAPFEEDKAIARELEATKLIIHRYVRDELPWGCIAVQVVPSSRQCQIRPEIEGSTWPMAKIVETIP